MSDLPAVPELLIRLNEWLGMNQVTSDIILERDISHSIITIEQLQAKIDRQSVSALVWASESDQLESKIEQLQEACGNKNRAMDELCGEIEQLQATIDRHMTRLQLEQSHTEQLQARVDGWEKFTLGLGESMGHHQTMTVLAKITRKCGEIKAKGSPTEDKHPTCSVCELSGDLEGHTCTPHLKVGG